MKQFTKPSGQIVSVSQACESLAVELGWVPVEAKAEPEKEPLEEEPKSSKKEEPKSSKSV